jgi:hypothetical protein
MGNGRRKDIERHLTEDELDVKLRDEPIRRWFDG